MKVFNIKETEKAFYQAKLDILSENEQLGSIYLEGGQIFGKVNVDGVYMGHEFTMRPKKGYGRNFNAMLNGKSALMYQDTVKFKKGLFARAYMTWIVETPNGRYETWLMGIGDRGYVHTTYFNDQPVAHITVPSVAINDMHEYTLTVYNDNNTDDVLSCFVYIVYHFILSHRYSPSQVMTKGKTVRIRKDKVDKEMLKKFMYLEEQFGIAVW